MAGVEITGVDELISALDSLPDKIEKQLLSRSLQALAEDYAKALSDIAPYDPTDKPGYYLSHKDAFTTKRGHVVQERFAQFVMLPHLKFSIVPENMNAAKGMVRKKILANYYARFLEDGTKYIEANPWIEETIDGIGDNLLQEFCEDLLQKILIMASIAGGAVG